jgi:small subunit ribosomal protein S16
MRFFEKIFNEESMVTIRLSRGGAKSRPFYHIVVADSRYPRDGRNIERVGLYNPIAKGGEERLRILTDRVQYWISNGAQPSERVAKLLKDHKATTAAASE